MISKLISLAICVFAVMACNDDNGLSQRRQTTVLEADAQAAGKMQISVMENDAALDPCGDGNKGSMVYVQEGSSLQICNGEQWEIVNSKSEPQTPATALAPTVFVTDGGSKRIGVSSFETFLGLNGYQAQFVRVLLADQNVMQVRPDGHLSDACHYQSDDCTGACLMDPGKIYLAVGIDNQLFQPGKETLATTSMSQFKASTGTCESQLLYHPGFIKGESYAWSGEAPYPFEAPIQVTIDNP